MSPFGHNQGHMPKQQDGKKAQKGCPQNYCLRQNQHFSILSATMTTNVIRLGRTLVVTKETYARVTIWKEKGGTSHI